MVTDTNEQDGFAKAVRRSSWTRLDDACAEERCAFSTTRRPLARGAAEFLCEAAERSAGRFVVSLSGGSTPKPMYQSAWPQDPLKAPPSRGIECTGSWATSASCAR